ncbi:MAG: hypothetical protein BJ554DRAFT_2085, partial [Olpidium bornovanus]
MVTARGELLQDERRHRCPHPLPPTPPLTHTQVGMNEEKRLAAVVAQITHDAELVPRGAFYRDATEQLQVNPLFRGEANRHVNRAETRIDGVGGKGEKSRTTTETGRLLVTGIANRSTFPGQNFAVACQQYGRADKVENLASFLYAPAQHVYDIPGTLPRGVTGETYVSIAKRKPLACLLLLDGVKDVIGSLETGNVDICKVNVEELTELVRASEETADAAGGRAIPALARRLREAYPIKILGVTDGPRNAFLFEFGSDGRTGRCSEYELPNLAELAREMALAEIRSQETTEPPFLNPLGAGDTANAVMLIELLEGKVKLRHPVDAFRAALAAASASCFVLDKS